MVIITLPTGEISLCLFRPDVSPSLFVPHRLLLSVPLKVEASSLL